MRKHAPYRVGGVCVSVCVPSLGLAVWLTVESDHWRPSGERGCRTDRVQSPQASHKPALRSTWQKASSGLWHGEKTTKLTLKRDTCCKWDEWTWNPNCKVLMHRSYSTVQVVIHIYECNCVFIPCVPWTGQSWSSCSSEAPPLELPQLRVMSLSRAAWLAATDPKNNQSTDEWVKGNWTELRGLSVAGQKKKKQKRILLMFNSLKTYFPQSFLIPLWLFLFSGETGDCCPESTPEDRGDWSDRTHSSSFSGRSARQKHKNTITDAQQYSPCQLNVCSKFMHFCSVSYW